MHGIGRLRCPLSFFFFFFPRKWQIKLALYLPHLTSLAYLEMNSAKGLSHRNIYIHI